MTTTRSSLLSRVRDFDDATGWEEFDRLYRPLLTGYARHRGLSEEDAEEIAQQCLTAVVKQIQRFHRNHSFRGWLRGMVNRKVADYFTARARCRRADTAALRSAEEPPLSPAELWQQQWNHAHVQYILTTLRTDFAPHTLHAFRLYVLHEEPTSNISECLGMTPNQIYVAKRRVIQRIRQRYGEVLGSLYGASE